MASSCFIGTTCSEPSGKSSKDIYQDYLDNYRLIRKQAGEPSYIVAGIDWGHRHHGRLPVVIGDWK